MAKTILKLEDAQVEALARVLDASLKAHGIKVIDDSAVIWAELKKALDAKKEAEE